MKFKVISRDPKKAGTGEIIYEGTEEECSKYIDDNLKDEEWTFYSQKGYETLLRKIRKGIIK